MGVSHIKVLGAWVLLKIKPNPGLVQTNGGIFVEAQSKLGYCEAEVISVGEGKLDAKTGARVPSGVRPGDMAYVRWYLSEVNSSSFTQYLDPEHFFVHQDDIYGVMEEVA